jgi:catechol 2,3-dioxygenase-like lactoylglutathione lyase family enzyme
LGSSLEQQFRRAFATPHGVNLGGIAQRISYSGHQQAEACDAHAMFSHIFCSVTDFDRGFRFHSAVMAALGFKLRWHDAARPWAGWESPGTVRPYFVICHPFNREPHAAGNGQMTAFLASSRAVVDAAHAAALANGGSCEGPPGLRPEYHTSYYGAYFRDPDGNKFGVACHETA